MGFIGKIRIAKMKLKIKRILVPLDGSKNSLKGLEEAIYLAKEATDIMAAKNIKRLVLTEDDNTLSSIVTTRDIVDVFHMEVG